MYICGNYTEVMQKYSVSQQHVETVSSRLKADGMVIFEIQDYPAFWAMRRKLMPEKINRNCFTLQ
jgi:hypothetical protein